jgi:hypothetical protein
MFDVTEETGLPRVQVTDACELGKLVVLWTLDPASRPRTLAELRDQLRGIAVVPEVVESFGFCESRLGHLAIRLPSRDLLRENVARHDDPYHLDYPIPQFYADHFRPGIAPVLSPLDMLLARIGDHSLAPCR